MGEEKTEEMCKKKEEREKKKRKWEVKRQNKCKRGNNKGKNMHWDYLFRTIIHIKPLSFIHVA